MSNPAIIHNLKPYPAYKNSGVEWLGQVPEGWEVRKLRSILRAVTERNRSDLPLLSVVRSKGVIIRDVADHSENHNFIPDDLSNYKVVRKGQFAMNKMKAWQGSYGISKYDGIVSPAYYVFDTSDVYGDFFHVAVRSNSYVSFFVQSSDGVRIGQWDLSQSRMREIGFLLPPLPEQTAIVKYLNHVDRKVKRFIRAKRKLIALLEEQKRAIIHQAVTRGLDPNVPMKDSGIEWLGEVPEGWEVMRVKSLCSAIIDCRNRTPEAIDQGDFIVVRTTCIRNGKFSFEGSYKTDAANFRLWTARGVPKAGDVFFTREAPAGEACIVPDRSDLCMGQRMMLFRPDPDLLDAQFLLMNIYGSLAKTYIDLATNGSTVGHLRLGQVHSIPIVWCPVKEQREIVSAVNSAITQIDTTITRTQREIELLNEYRTRLISDVVTGKLDVREAAAALPEEMEQEEPEEIETDEGGEVVEETDQLLEEDL